MEKKVPRYSDKNSCVLKRLQGKKGKEKNSHKQYVSGQCDKT